MAPKKPPLPVTQSGRVTPTHIAVWTTDGVIQDGGSTGVGPQGPPGPPGPQGPQGSPGTLPSTSPPTSITATGTFGQFAVDQRSGDLWLAVSTNLWNVYKGCYTNFNIAQPRGVVVDVFQEPYASLVVAGDWTAALNAASAYILATDTKIGTIVLPPFDISISDTWNIGDTAGVGPGTGYAVTINIEGSAVSSISYVGPLDGRPAIRVAKNKRFTFRNFALSQIVSGNPGTSIGLALGGSNTSDSSTQCTGGVLQFVQIAGFQTNLTDFIGAASELVFMNCWFSRAVSSFGLGYNTWGVRFDQFNSTNHAYFGCSWGNNDIGLDVSNTSMVTVCGGNSNTQSVDFQAGLRCRLSLDGIRQDGFGVVTTGRFVVGSSGLVSIRNCRVNLGNGGDGISISGTFRQFSMVDSVINGYVRFDDVANTKSIVMTGNQLWVRGTTFLPFIVASGIGSQAECQVLCRDNSDTSGDIYDGSPVRAPIINFDGRFGTDDFSDFIFDPNVWIQPVGTADSFAGGYTDPIGAQIMMLHRVKCLSETRVPIQSPFFNADGPFASGANLRVQGKFNSSGTLALTFQNTISVTAPGGTTIVRGSGAWLTGDVGKQVLITGGGNPSGDFNGYIDRLNSSTAAVVIPANAQHSPSYAGSKNAVIGANEPDGNYMVLVTGNVNETFWVDTISSSGFTVHSSNASSTATVTCLIIR